MPERERLRQREPLVMSAARRPPDLVSGSRLEMSPCKRALAQNQSAEQARLEASEVREGGRAIQLEIDHRVSAPAPVAGGPGESDAHRDDACKRAQIPGHVAKTCRLGPDRPGLLRLERIKDVERGHIRQRELLEPKLAASR